MDRIYQLIKLNRMIKSYRLKFLMVLFCDLVGARHLFLRLDPVNACNLRCGMCYYSSEGYAKNTRGIFREEDINRIAELFFAKTLQLVIGAASEPTLYKNYTNIIRIAKDYKVPYVGFTTNAQLLTENSITRMVDMGLDEITISIHGVTKQTYENLMTNASFEKLTTVLYLLKKAKDKKGSRKPHLRINYTINRDNLEELEDFFEVYGEFDIHTLQLRPMDNIGETAYPHVPFDESVRIKYDNVLEKLIDLCAEQNITLLATKQNINHDKEEKGSSYALPAVLRFISPNCVWMPAYDWKTESYRQFCRRISWRWTLVQSIFRKEELFEKSKRFLTYDVMD